MTHIFIVNPFAGTGVFADELRAELEQIPKLNYYIFSTRYRGDEEKLIARVLDIFEGEELRFYVCGGNGTLHHVLNGFENFENVQIAFYPCGFSNDFLKCFGDDADRFRNIQELINGDVIDVDYIQTNHCKALNSFTIGLDGDVISHFNKMNPSTKRGKNFGLLWSIFAGSLSYRPNDLDIRIDGFHIQDFCSELALFNGSSLADLFNFEEKPNISDGLAFFFVLPPLGRFKLLKLLHMLATKGIKTLQNSGKSTHTSKMTVRSRLNIPLLVNIDGEIYPNETSWEVVVVRKGLKMVVPKGVKA